MIWSQDSEKKLTAVSLNFRGLYNSRENDLIMNLQISIWKTREIGKGTNKQIGWSREYQMNTIYMALFNSSNPVLYTTIS